MPVLDEATNNQNTAAHKQHNTITSTNKSAKSADSAKHLAGNVNQNNNNIHHQHQTKPHGGGGRHYNSLPSRDKKTTVTQPLIGESGNGDDNRHHQHDADGVPKHINKFEAVANEADPFRSTIITY